MRARRYGATPMVPMICALPVKLTAVFDTSRSFTVGTGAGRGLAAADFNGDGLMDLAVGNTALNLLMGDGTGAFLPGPVPTMPVGVQLVTADFNTDGKPDLAGAAVQQVFVWLIP